MVSLVVVDGLRGAAGRRRSFVLLLREVLGSHVGAELRAHRLLLLLQGVARLLDLRQIVSVGCARRRILDVVARRSAGGVIRPVLALAAGVAAQQRDESDVDLRLERSLAEARVQQDDQRADGQRQDGARAAEQQTGQQREDAVGERHLLLGQHLLADDQRRLAHIEEVDRRSDDGGEADQEHRHPEAGQDEEDEEDEEVVRLVVGEVAGEAANDEGGEAKMSTGDQSRGRATDAVSSPQGSRSKKNVSRIARNNGERGQAA